MKVVFDALDIIIDKKLWPEKKPSDILRILLYVHGRGWLYTPVVDGQVTAVICAYRIKEGDSLTAMPVKEEGTTLYVPFALSLVGNNLFKIIRETLNLYIKDNPDIEELVLEDKNNKIKRYNLRGASNGQEQRPRVTSNPNVSK